MIILRLHIDAVERESKLDLEHQQLHTLICTLPDLIWLKDVDGVYLTCNPRFEQFFGVPVANIIGKKDYDFVDKNLADFFREKDLLAMSKSSPSVNEEAVTFAVDGHTELLETTKTQMLDSNGKLIGVLGLGHDITQRKNNEEQLRELNEKLREHEKREIYLSTVQASQHILNNLLNQLQLFKMEAEESTDFDKDVLKLFDAVLHEAGGLVLNLSTVTHITKDNIKSSVAPR